MKPKEIIVEDATIIIRLMDTEYTVGEDPEKAGIEYKIKCWPGKSVEGSWPNPPVVTYHRKLTEIYGASAITAWNNNSLIGFLPFYPLNCGLEKVNCVCAPIEMTIEKINNTNLVPLDKFNKKILEVQCLSVNHKYNRKGIGTAMSKYLIEWAKDKGWDKIQGWAFSESNFLDAYKWLPSVHFWQKSGFKIEKSRKMDMGDLGNVSVSDFSIDLKY